MEWVMGLLLGVGLSACCGFRVFVPLLVSNVATLAGWLPAPDGFAWLHSWVAFATLAAATVAEIAAYYVPWLDHALDTLALPASVGAGTLLTTSVLGDQGSEPLRWALGLLVGGGSAGVVQASTSLLRLGSAATTGTLANPLVATAENAAAVVFSTLAVLLPALVGGLALLLVAWLTRRLLRRRPA